MDPVWANTWRRFFFLKTRPLPSRRGRTWDAAWEAAPPSVPPEVDEDTARRMLAEINSREGQFIDYD